MYALHAPTGPHNALQKFQGNPHVTARREEAKGARRVSPVSVHVGGVRHRWIGSTGPDGRARKLQCATGDNDTLPPPRRGYGLVAMTFASHAKGREFDPHYPYIICIMQLLLAVVANRPRELQ